MWRLAILWLAFNMVAAVGQIIGGVIPAPPPAPPISLRAGAPLSAEILSETTHALLDGTQLTQRRTTSRVYRDSKGRVRAERPVGLDQENHAEPILVDIYDPVAGWAYTLNTHQKIAQATSISTQSGPPPPSSLPRFWPLNPSTLPPGARSLPGAMLSRSGELIGLKPERTTQSLGTEQSEGVTLVGTRIIVALPVGWEGYDRAFKIALETWVSNDLDCLVHWTMSDPRVGRSTWKLTHIDRHEPDASLFRVPLDFTTGGPDGKH